MVFVMMILNVKVVFTAGLYEPFVPADHPITTADPVATGFAKTSSLSRIASTVCAEAAVSTTIKPEFEVELSN